MIVLVATMKAKPGKETELESTLTAVIPQVEQEPGTLQYVLHRSQQEAGKFLFYEKYVDKAALDFHGSTPYLKELFKAIAGLLAEKPVIEIYEEVAGINK